MASQETADHVTRISATRARGGRWGKHVLWVLIVSTVMAALVLAAVWGMKAGDLASVEGNQRANTPAEAAQGTTTQAPIRQTETTPAI